MIVGQAILDRGLVRGATAERLKNSTLDLTIGDIIPIGKEGLQRRRSQEGVQSYIIDPREMVWILSTEEFCLPNNVTGIATLRTTFTQRGMLALNVGIVDPFFDGPISTALINFSDVPREIRVGEPFFRVVFIEHEDVTTFHRANESRQRSTYLSELERQSLASDFPQNFLSIPKLDDKYYSEIFGRLVWGWIKNNRIISITVAVIFSAMFYYVWQDGVGAIVTGWVKWINDFLSNLKVSG